MYDCFLGGKDNFAADREAAQHVIAAYPEIRDLARQNRAFLARAVRYATGQGIRQFVDIGAGLPAPGSTHEVAHQVDPDARVLYVDCDPMVLAHARARLAACDPDSTSVVDGDLRRPEAIMDHPGLRKAIDLALPVAVLLVAVLHFIPDEDDPARIVATITGAMAPGSYLIVSHGSADFVSPEAAAECTHIYQHTTEPLTLRTRAEIEALLHGLDLVHPGLVQIPLWKPAGKPPAAWARISAYAAVARKP
jgi:O-methyltransferase involved in polyketide biosynthesis